MDQADLVAALRPHMSAALVATDFDGTLAPLQRDPERSRLVPGALDALVRLAEHGAQVAIITGRDARTAVRLGGLDAIPGLIVIGLYGAETWTAGVGDSSGGELHTPDTPPQIDELRDRLPGALHDGDPAIWVEDKRLSLVVHARLADDPSQALDAVRASVTEVGDTLGFEVHPGSGVIEFRLPGYDKGAALARLAPGRSAVLFLGDDTGDLPAFEQIRALRADGMPAWAVGVLSTGVDGIAEAADLTLRDPPAVAVLLRELSA